MFSENSYQKIEANSNMTVFFCSGIINILFGLIARIFPRPCEARKNTTQLAKYPHVLDAKPSNKVYLLQVFFSALSLSLYYYNLLFFCMQKKNQFYKTVSHALNSITRDQETILHDHNDTDVKHKKCKMFRPTSSEYLK